MKGILFRRLVLLFVFGIHAVMKCEATFCIDHYNKLVKEIREHQSYCSDQVKSSPCFCEAEASSLEERKRNYKILCHEDYCRKDLIILLDASSSIGSINFNEHIKTFLESLINDRQLDVGPEGTHISILSFSEKRKTKVRLQFGEKTTKKELLDFIKYNLTYDELNGSTTRTGYALQKVNEIFENPSPANLRQIVGDVVMIITDGEPRGGPRGEETRRAKHQAGLLKKKGVLIVGIAISRTNIPMEERMQFKNVIKNITTKPEYTFDAGFDGFISIVNKLVEASCINPKPACDCATASTKVVSLQPGNSQATVDWTVPKPPETCSASLKSVTPPNVSSRHSFPFGKHTVKYVYKTNAGDVTCNVNIQVKGPD